MKSLTKVAIAAAVLSAPLITFAQSNGPLTRGQVKAEVAQLEKAGYTPAGSNDYNYPQYFQAAQSRVSIYGNKDTAAADIGGSINGASESGLAVSSKTGHSIYAGY